MKERLLTLTLLLTTFAVGWADEWEDPETHVIYTYTPGTTEAAVKAGPNLMGSGSPNASGDIEIRTSFVGADEGTYNVTSIGNYAFVDCGLTRVRIPNSVQDIGESAFNGCSELTQIELPEGLSSLKNSTFMGCAALTAIDIPLSVISLGNDVFHNCSRLTEVLIPINVNSIGSSVFQDCTNLITITIPYGVTAIENYTFYGCSALESAVIPSSVGSIGRSAFEGCSMLEVTLKGSTPPTLKSNAFDTQAIMNVPYGSLDTYQNTAGWDSYANQIIETLPKSPLTIDGITYTFIEDHYVVGRRTGTNIAYDINDTRTSYSILNEITAELNEANGTSVPVTEVSSYAFQDCQATTILIPDGIVSILSGAFRRSKITSVNIPKSVTNIHGTAFQDAPIVEFTVDENNATYSSIDGVLFSKDQTALVYYPKERPNSSYTIPANVTAIGNLAFYGHPHIAEVILPINLTSIGNSAFRECQNIKSINIPSSVSTIDSYAFLNCPLLTSVIFEGNSPVSNFGQYTFGQGESIGNYSYRDNSSLSLFVPDNVSETYKSVVNTGDVDKVKELPDVALNGVKYYHVFAGDGSVCSVCGSAKAHYHVGDKSDGGGFDLATMPEDGKINVLGELNGIPVRVITMNSFRNATAIKEVQISDDIVSIHGGAFWGCTELRSINLPSKIDVIASYAFRDCQNLTSINIPEQVKTIGTFSFYNCAALESVTFPEGVTDINGQSFQKCRSLTSVNIPASVTLLYGDAFRQCSSLVAINVDESNSNYLDIDGVLFLKSAVGPLTLKCYPAGKADESYTLPTNVKSVDSNAFKESLVKKINIPSGELKTIGSNAFGYADELEEVYISEGVEKVRDGFIYCHSLRHVEIPSSVTVIESGTFFDCTALREVIFKGMTPPEIEKYTFDKEDEVTHGEVSNEIVRLYVPASAIDAYIAALEADRDKPKVRGLLNVSFDNESEWATLLTSDYGDETYQLGVPEGTKAYVVTGTDGSAIQTTEIEYLPKGVPVLLKKTGEVGEYIGAARVAVADMTDEQKDVAKLADGSIFKGVEEPTDIADISGTKYVLYKDKFIETTSGTLKKNRCYLLLDEAGARVMNIVTDDEATGIARVADDENGEKWYSLDGRSLQGKPARKGLYIRNGKKVVVK